MLSSCPTIAYTSPSSEHSSKNRTWPEWNQSKEPVTTTRFRRSSTRGVERGQREPFQPLGRDCDQGDAVSAEGRRDVAGSIRRNGCEHGGICVLPGGQCDAETRLRHDCVDEANGFQQVPPFLERELARPVHMLDKTIRPQPDRHRAQAGCLVQKPDFAGARVVESPGYKDVRHASLRSCVVLIFTWKPPGTGSSDTTYRYPPPQPEYIAPW